jgi:hypothetical protein
MFFESTNKIYRNTIMDSLKHKYNVLLIPTGTELAYKKLAEFSYKPGIGQTT